MCGWFDTSHMTWTQIHDALSRFIPVKSAPLNLEPSVRGGDDVLDALAQMFQP